MMYTDMDKMYLHNWEIELMLFSIDFYFYILALSVNTILKFPSAVSRHRYEFKASH